MDNYEQLISAITKAVEEQLQKKNAQPQPSAPAAPVSGSLAGRTRLRPKRS